ncbi:hypothetical protein Pint_18568 [Pistacia integerrima]|uniref:Uncharacterized protein n=1 Tax=Pistacia integerrima TaxID=434235 RepID=A0ACC0YZH5_9ROSI|nr:hypothetical protein Pint_18568 [Pistacia integerrima]
MSVLCGAECVFIVGFGRWLWKRCTYVGSDDSASWSTATPDEFETVPRVCQLILAVYETDLRHPQFPPPGGYKLNPDWVVKRLTYEHTHGRAPPYLIYVDHNNREIILAIRGLNLVKESDYKTLLDNRLGRQMFDGGYVHHGLLKSAQWLLNQESETLKRLWIENGSEYDLIFAGHSLGSGVAALATIVVVNHRDKLGGMPRSKIKCYAVAPARCMSLNLAVKYADVINSIILQDDFLPRTATPLEDIFKSIFWDTFIPEGRKLRDPRRLYAPGRMYHIVERKFCSHLVTDHCSTECIKISNRCGRFPPEVKTAIPVDGRFEHIVLSCNATSDHGIVWIEREAEKALQRMRESSPETITTPPKVQKLERLQSIKKEHKDALERAVSLNIPHAVTDPEEPQKNEAESSQGEHQDASNTKSKSSSGNWDHLVEKLFKKSETGQLILNKDLNASKDVDASKA